LKELPQLGWFQSNITIHLIGQVKHLTAVTSTDLSKACDRYSLKETLDLGATHTGQVLGLIETYLK